MTARFSHFRYRCVPISSNSWTKITSKYSRQRRVFIGELYNRKKFRAGQTLTFEYICETNLEYVIFQKPRVFFFAQALWFLRHFPCVQALLSLRQNTNAKKCVLNCFRHHNVHVHHRVYALVANPYEQLEAISEIAITVRARNLEVGPEYGVFYYARGKMKYPRKNYGYNTLSIKCSTRTIMSQLAGFGPFKSSIQKHHQVLHESTHLSCKVNRDQILPPCTNAHTRIPGASLCLTQ